MTFPTLGPTPPRGPERPPGSTPPGPASARRGGGRPDYRRALRIGLAVSLAFHLIVLFLVGRALKVPFAAAPPLRQPPPPAEGLRVVPLAPPSAPSSERPAPGQPERQARRPEKERPSRPAPAAPPTAAPGLPSPDTIGLLTNAEKLQPKEGDPRLWLEFDEERMLERHPRASVARADSAIRAIVRAYLDSLDLSEEARRRAMDWTFGKGDKKWGIASDGLHLGKIVIPIPFGQFFSEGGDRGRAAAQALHDLGEIRSQDLQQQIDEILKERKAAMRKRSEEEAAKRKEQEQKGTGKDTVTASGP